MKNYQRVNSLMKSNKSLKESITRRRITMEVVTTLVSKILLTQRRTTPSRLS